MGRKKTKEEFISDANKVHKGKYVYTNVMYVNNKTLVDVICPIHGTFSITPNAHLSQRQGCPICGGTKRSNIEEFIEKANEVHGGKYDYSKVIYTNNRTKVCIICPEHGEFWQTPNKHLLGRGCPRCNGKNKTNDQFIRECKDIFGDIFEYDKVEYVDSRTKVKLVCKIHGDFIKTPHDLLSGQGCPYCQTSHLEMEAKEFLDENEIRYIHQANRNTFEWLSLQTLDFYLPDYDVAIECQGRQHFIPVEHFGGEIEYAKTTIRDSRKSAKCKNNGIRLLYYTNFKMDEYPYEVFIDKEKLLKEIKNGKRI